MKLLLTEDDPQIGEGLVLGLGGAGFQVDWVQQGEQALVALRHTPYDLWVLDLGLPDMDGLEVLRQSQALAACPATLILSARHIATDRVMGLNLGADDYLVKPFDFDELLARLHALHRRSQGRRDPLIRVGDLCIDPIRRTVALAGQAIPLSPREFDLLQALAEHPGAVRSAQWLESRLYRWGTEVASNAIQVHLHHLRRKLGEGWLHNVRGTGYKLEQAARPIPAADNPSDPAPVRP
ncbi:MAG: response regulator transcription factor [Burkholderiaceae bacterium]|nr:response regulator transcription factor [Burkholderiaceae bacterium]MDP3131766.1 response regulator transcription factor [Burkholderiaceae bacterium]MDZ4161161.1 response regulator transcription factor [Burkholderiales bacterium]